MNLILCIATSLSTLYSSLDPTSVREHFAFYELYPETSEGKKALQTAWSLLNQEPLSLDPHPLIQLVNKGLNQVPLLKRSDLQVIQKISSSLLNRKLQGFGVWSLSTLKRLPSEEIDLARALLLMELGEEENVRTKIESYEAHLDLMALQISARLTESASSEEKIRAINDYVFSEMRFRFPPHSLHAKDIDLYTFLPSVLDGRRGVCLGVSTLYLCLAQRLGLSLEAITPPGHIYVRYVDPETKKTINIETTARGIDVPSERYLGIETPKLQQRTIREVVGLSFMNQAAVNWQKEDFQTAVALYEKAKPFLEDDYLLDLFLGFNYLFVGRKKEGRALLEKVHQKVPGFALGADLIVEDYLSGFVQEDAIQAVYSEVNEKRASILKKQKKLQEITQKYPKFRQGYFHLATTWLQLGREKEAIPLLEKYLSMNPKDAVASYYLSAIQFQRRNYPEAWKHLQQTEQILFQKNHHPVALQELRQALLRSCPEPS